MYLKFNKVIETCIYSTNLAKMKQFYADILGLELVSEESERSIFFKVGKSMLLVFNPEKTRTDSGSVFPLHGAIPPSEIHVALEVSKSDLESAKQLLSQKGIGIEKELVWNGSKSVYFRDPANNLIEIISEGAWPVEQ